MPFVAPLFLIAYCVTIIPGEGRFWGTPNFYSTRSTIVHLDQWLYDDVQRECSEHLDKSQIAAVLVSAPNDHAFKTGRALDGQLQYRHYSERYQPVSFTKLDSASGTFEQFKRMVQACNENNIRVYADVVLGHTTSSSSHESYAGTEFDATNIYFQDFHATDFFPAGRCPTRSGNVEDSSDRNQLLNCREQGWLRLDLQSVHVQNVLGTYLQTLQLAGVSGFRIAYADRLDVYDLEAVLDKLLPSTTLHDPNPISPFVFFDAPLASSSSRVALASLGALVNTTIASNIDKIVRRQNTWELLTGDESLWRIQPDQVFSLARSEAFRAVSINDYWRRVLVNIVMMTLPRGIPLIYAGWRPQEVPAQGIRPEDLGPPSSPDFDTLPVISTKEGLCTSGWNCIHRQKPLSHFPAWRNVAGRSVAINVRLSNGGDTLSFARKERSFVVVATGEKAARGDFNTTLREGFYCDVVSGERIFETTCTGDKYRVYDNHFINVLGESRIHRSRRLPIMAVHEESRTASESENRQSADIEVSNIVIV